MQAGIITCGSARFIAMMELKFQPGGAVCLYIILTAHLLTLMT